MKSCVLAAPSGFVATFQTIKANPITERRGNKPFSLFGAVDMVLSVTIRPDLLTRKTLSGALGHYSAGFTLSTYTHATAEMKRDAADTIGNVISQAM